MLTASDLMVEITSFIIYPTSGHLKTIIAIYEEHNIENIYLNSTMSEDNATNGTANGTANGKTSPFKIPVVDFSSWNDSKDKEARLRVAQEIVDASKKVGFVYIINHALPESLLDEAFDWSKRFFAQSLEEKMKAPHPEGWAVHRGYSWPGLEKVSQAMGEGDDEQRVKKLREIKDCKVCSTSFLFWETNEYFFIHYQSLVDLAHSYCNLNVLRSMKLTRSTGKLRHRQ